MKQSNLELQTEIKDFQNQYKLKMYQPDYDALKEFTQSRLQSLNDLIECLKRDLFFFLQQSFFNQDYDTTNKSICVFSHHLIDVFTNMPDFDIQTSFRNLQENEK